MALLSKLKLTTAVMTGVVAVSVFGLGLLPGPTPVSVARAAPVPKNDGLTADQKKELDDLWKKLDDPRAGSTDAALRFAKQPDAATVYLKQKLKPLQLDVKEAKALIAKLFGDKEDEAKEAEQELTYRTPLLAMSITDMWAEAKTDDERLRLAYLLVGGHTGLRANCELKDGPGGGFTLYVPPAGPLSALIISVPHKLGMDDFRYDWHRAERAMYVLEQIGTPAAVKVIEGMAGGHPEAVPTKTAKAVLARLKKK